MYKLHDLIKKGRDMKLIQQQLFLSSLFRWDIFIKQNNINLQLLINAY